MGITLSSQINGFLIQYLKSLKTGSELYTLKKYEQEFNSGDSLSPKIKTIVKKFSVISPDEFLFDDSTDLMEQSINVKTATIVLEIGEAAVECAELGFNVRVSGRVTIFDVQLKAVITPSFENGIRISECDSTVQVKKIKSDLHLSVNGRDYSNIANLLLSSVIPEMVNTVLNAVLKFQKGNIRDYLNSLLENV